MGPARLLSIRRVAIIGAGPSGLAAAKYFRAENWFSVIHVYEQRDNVGGLWNHTSEASGDGLFDVPQTNPHHGLEKAVPRVTKPNEGAASVFISPIYNALETNIPYTLMRYSDLSFSKQPGGISLFPSHTEVLAYLEEYGKDVLSMIRFNTQVSSVKTQRKATTESTEPPNNSWVVESQQLPSGATSTATYDAVVVASGHYATPNIPEIDGAHEWNEKFPGSISHSKYFRSAADFEKKKVIVIGNSASGLDISSQIAGVCAAPLYLSQKSESYLAQGFSANPSIKNVPQIVRFVPEERKAVFSDGSEATEVDCVVFCTGYLYTMPFLRDLQPNHIGNGTRVQHTFQHLLYSPEPTLSFLALPQKVIPFPVSESQSAVLARLYSGRLAVPSLQEMRNWEEATVAERGTHRAFHMLPFPKDANYINMLHDWAMQADIREGIENNGLGKMPNRWGAWECWAREKFPAIKKAYADKGAERRNVKSIEDLGFVFDTRDIKLESSDNDL